MAEKKKSKDRKIDRKEGAQHNIQPSILFWGGGGGAESIPVKIQKGLCPLPNIFRLIWLSNFKFFWFNFTFEYQRLSQQ